jgi:hypothetical protein
MNAREEKEGETRSATITDRTKQHEVLSRDLLEKLTVAQLVKRFPGSVNTKIICRVHKKPPLDAVQSSLSHLRVGLKNRCACYVHIPPSHAP